MSMYGLEVEKGVRFRPVVACGTEGGAKQSFKDECDINNIIARYVQTGLLTPVNTRPQEFVDVSMVGDYQSALENVRSAGAMFNALPSGIRAEFDNDPATFLDFCTDSQNEERMRDMGLLPPMEPSVEGDPAPEEPEPEGDGD